VQAGITDRRVKSTDASVCTNHFRVLPGIALLVKTAWHQGLGLQPEPAQKKPPTPMLFVGELGE